MIKISAKLSIIMSAIFAAICLGVAGTGFTSLGEIIDPVQLADAKGFAWFWAFLGMVALVFCGLGVWLVQTHRDSEDD